MNESQLKSKIVKKIRDNKTGYARRFEDQYAVGLPDMIIIPNGGDVWFMEAKVTRTLNETWGPSPRQEIELDRIVKAGGNAAVMCYCKASGNITIVDWKTKDQTDFVFQADITDVLVKMKETQNAK